MELPVKYDELNRRQKRLVKELYIEQQKGLCCFCKCPLDGNPSDEVMNRHISEKWFPKGFFENPVHLHHNHNTGLTIGAVHCRCNAYLWQYLGE